MLHNVDITTIYQYGAYEIKFKNKFYLKCAPFFGMGIYDHSDEYEIYLEIKNIDNFIKSNITYDVKNDRYLVDIYNKLDSSYQVNNIIKQYEKSFWTRIDDIDIVELNKLIDRRK